jgi:hypothetical protein
MLTEDEIREIAIKLFNDDFSLHDVESELAEMLRLQRDRIVAALRADSSATPCEGECFRCDALDEFANRLERGELP